MGRTWGSQTRTRSYCDVCSEHLRTKSTIPARWMLLSFIVLAYSRFIVSGYFFSVNSASSRSATVLRVFWHWIRSSHSARQSNSLSKPGIILSSVVSSTTHVGFEIFFCGSLSAVVIIFCAVMSFNTFCVSTNLHMIRRWCRWSSTMRTSNSELYISWIEAPWIRWNEARSLEKYFTSIVADQRRQRMAVRIEWLMREKKHMRNQKKSAHMITFVCLALFSLRYICDYFCKSQTAAINNKISCQKLLSQ